MRIDFGSDWWERTVDAIASDRADIRKALVPMYASTPHPGYSLPMAWRCAVAASNEVVDAVPRYSSADHGSLFKSLLAVILTVQSESDVEFSEPHFDNALTHDEVIRSCLELENHDIAFLDLEISLRQGYWRIDYHPDEDAFRLSLAPPQRRSALVLLDHKVEFLSYPPNVREILSGASDESSPTNTVSLTLATGLNEVVFLRDAVPEAWQHLTNLTGISIDEAVRFQAFAQALALTDRLWFRLEDLVEWFADFEKDQELPELCAYHLPRAKIEVRIDSAFFNQAIVDRLHSLGAKFTISVPFERFAGLKEMVEGRRRWRPMAGGLGYFETRWKPRIACTDSWTSFLLRLNALKNGVSPPPSSDSATGSPIGRLCTTYCPRALIFYRSSFGAPHIQITGTILLAPY